MKKIRAYSILIVVSTLLVTLLVGLTISPAVKATYDPATQGSRTTAFQKQWFSMLESCTKNQFSWYPTVVKWGGSYMSPAKIKSKDWFKSFVGAATISNPYVESQIEGQYGDGWIYCGQENNQLPKKALASLNLDPFDVACDYNNHANNGLMGDPNGVNHCDKVYESNDDNMYFGISRTGDNATEYMNNLVRDKTFEGNIPGGSMEKLASVEAYFVVYDSFTIACAAGSPDFEDPTSNAVVIWAIDEKDNQKKQAGFSIRSDRSLDTKIKFFYNKSMTCGDMVKFLRGDKDVKVDDVSGEDAINALQEYSDAGGTAGGENLGAEDACYEKAGLDSVSYIVCPAINNTTSVVDTIEEVLRTLLEVDPNDAFSSETYEAWNIFRNIANIFLIIILLIIIFSQLTGYGIDNYGIKKMLPRLIAMAIVINLSYVICELAVDISNILGSGLYELFKGIGMTVNADAAGQDTATIVGGILGALGGASVPVAGAVVAGIAAGGGVMIVISLVLLLLVALVAVVLVFLMLGVRMAIIILFVAISPVAFALYILPNTQNIFKKYWKIAEAALVVFPICGAVCGASFIIRAILLSNSIDGVIPVVSALVAICMPFLPFFLLPSLLRNVIGGLGAIGGVLSGIGNGLRRGTQSLGDTVKTGVRNSEGFKNAANRRAENRQNAWARRTADRLNRRSGGNLNNLSESQRRRLYQANTILNDREKQRIQDSIGVMPFNADAARTRLENEQLRQRMEDEVGVIPVDQGLARQRALSQRRSQELKNYTDQYSTLTRNAMGNELQAATAAYRTNKNEQNSIRLQAAIMAADGRGMNRELLDALGQSGQNGLSLLGDNDNDQTILSQLSGSKNKVLNQFAKARAKNSTQSMSLHDFMNGTIANDNLADVFNSKGPEIMNGIDDDTLSYINNNGGGARIHTQTILNAATQTSDAKELAQLNFMLQNRTGFDMKTSDFAKIKKKTFDALDPSVYTKALAELRNGSESSQRIISQMDQEIRKILNV